VLLAGVAGFRDVGHNASASFLKRWISDNTFAWRNGYDVKVYLHIRKLPRNTVFEVIKSIARRAIVISDADPD
jgi:hypothetical protein